MNKKIATKDKLSSLKQKTKRLGTTLKLLTGLSFGLLGTSLSLGIATFTLEINDNLNFEKQKAQQNLTYSDQVYSPETKSVKAIFMASTYSMIASIGGTLITYNIKENAEKKLKIAKNAPKSENYNEN